MNRNGFMPALLSLFVRIIEQITATHIIGRQGEKSKKNRGLLPPLDT